MPRLKKKCPECDADQYEFYHQVLCLNCGRLEEPSRPPNMPPSTEGEISEALELLGAIHRHHIGVVRRSYRMMDSPPSFAKTDEERAKIRNRMSDRLDEHGEYVGMMNVVGATLESALSSLRFHKRLSDKLGKQLDEQRVIPILLNRARDELMKHPVLRAPALYVWNKLTWGV
jgi:hypothetical protein